MRSTVLCARAIPRARYNPHSASVLARKAASLKQTLRGNGIAGVVFGWIFRRRGLEAAMVAHGAADVWLQAALPALLA